MTDRPIIFSAPMVRALLDGRKTQTRRTVTPQTFRLFNPVAGSHRPDPLVLKTALTDVSDLRRVGDTSTFVWRGDCLVNGRAHWQGRPIWDIGDRLWVRESFTLTQFGKAVYRADALDEGGQRWSDIVAGDPDREVRWKPSIHMPRAKSRLTLVVTDVRVQRLQEVSEEDAAAEGWEKQPWRSGDPEVHHDAARDWFMDLWDSLNARRGYGWEVNPWVVAVTFDVHHCNIDDMEGAAA